MSVTQRTSVKYFVAMRLLQAIPLLLGVIVLSFILIHLTPGDITVIFAGNAPVSKAFLEALRHQFGLDQPLYVQFFLYLSNIIHGNLGYSYFYSEPVLDLILQRLPVTLTIVLLPLVVTPIVGVILGVSASRKQYSATDNVISLVSLAGYSIPAFWSGQLLILFFGLYLKWFPVEGFVTLGANLQGIPLIVNILDHQFLPGLLIGSIQIALVTRLTRAGMLEAYTQDYITWARAKGQKERTIAYRHALRNALLPIVTLVGYNFGLLLTGAVFTETVFALPGLGTLLVSAILNHDFPIITGQLIFVSFMVITANLITDLAYGFVDPRIRQR